MRVFDHCEGEAMVEMVNQKREVKRRRTWERARGKCSFVGWLGIFFDNSA